MSREKPICFLGVSAELEGGDPDGLRDARNGGFLRLEGGIVNAYAGGPSRKVGHVWSSEIVRHLATGGTAYFRLSDELGPRHIVCTLLSSDEKKPPVRRLSERSSVDAR